MIAYNKLMSNRVRLYISQYYSRYLSPAIGVEYERLDYNELSPRFPVQLDSLSRNASLFGRPLEFDHNELMDNIDRLMKAAYTNNESIKAIVKQIVTTYEPKEVI